MRRITLSLLFVLVAACGAEEVDNDNTSSQETALRSGRFSELATACPEGTEHHGGYCVPIQDDVTVVGAAKDLARKKGDQDLYSVNCNPSSNLHNFTCKCETSGACLLLQISGCTHVDGAYWACEDDHSDPRG